MYLDIDTICQANVAEMYDLDLEGHVAAGVYYYGSLSEYLCPENRDELSKILLTKDKISPLALDYHFNAGVMLLDLKTFGEQRVLEEWNRLLLIHKQKCLWRLQNAAFSLAAHGMFLILPDSWNIGDLGWMKGKENVDKCKTAKVLHWNGPNKPWKVNDGGSVFCDEIWHKYDMALPVEIAKSV